MISKKRSPSSGSLPGTRPSRPSSGFGPSTGRGDSSSSCRILWSRSIAGGTGSCRDRHLRELRKYSRLFSIADFFLNFFRRFFRRIVPGLEFFRQPVQSFLARGFFSAGISCCSICIETRVSCISPGSWQEVIICGRGYRPPENPCRNSGTTDPAAGPVVPLFPQPPFFRGHNSEKCGNGPE